jgi:hypothetical protein
MLYEWIGHSSLSLPMKIQKTNFKTTSIEVQKSTIELKKYFILFFIIYKCHIEVFFEIQCPPLNWITLGRIKSDSLNRMIQLTEETLSQKFLSKMEKAYKRYILKYNMTCFFSSKEWSSSGVNTIYKISS